MAASADTNRLLALRVEVFCPSVQRSW